MKKNLPLIAVVIFSVSMFLPSCIKSHHIGRSVDYFNPYCCRCYDLPKTCHIGLQDDYFIVEYTITNPSPGNYVIKGYMDPTQGKLKSWSHLTSQDTHFQFLLAKNGYIIDSIGFSPMGTGLSRKLPFERKFSSEPFDAILLIGSFGARG